MRWCTSSLRQGGQAAHVERNREVLRYRSPRSGNNATIVPDGRRLASRTAPATTAPLDIPKKSFIHSTRGDPGNERFPGQKPMVKLISG